jgi:galactose mutarotase-like enzyme
VIELESGSLRAVVDPRRGGDIVFVGRPGGPNVLFHDAWETPLAAGRSTTYGSGTLDWLSHYRGGWQVMFPNAGAECLVDGLPHPVHGEVSSAPAEVVEASSSHLVLRSATRLPLHLERRISLAAERPALLVEERAQNDSDWTMSYAWGHHPAIAATAGMRIDLPAGPLHVDSGFDDPAADLQPGAVGTWPEAALRDGGMAAMNQVPDGAVERVCYLPDRPAGWAAVRDPITGRGVGLAWDVEAFPHLWLWEQMNGRRFPFFGRARLVGIEPVSCWPGDGLARAIERGQASTIAPHGSASGWVTLSLFAATTDSVTCVDRDGEVSTTGDTTRPEP